jgi:serine phosphatase RsbU (regulator of sigma subunit)
MTRQLRAIGDLQRRLLPREVPQPTGWRVAAHYVVGRWPGGDYYDFITLPDGRLLLLVADASDEGAVSSALVAMTRVVLHSSPLLAATGSTRRFSRMPAKAPQPSRAQSGLPSRSSSTATIQQMT